MPLGRFGRADEVADTVIFLLSDASALFLDRLRGVTDPEKKRKIIGAAFIEVFEAEAKKLAAKQGGFDFLAQGTLYPDVIESVSVIGPSHVIKSHHNVGGLPERMKFKLVEPLRDLFKDEVRRVGQDLGLEREFVVRQCEVVHADVRVAGVGEFADRELQQRQASLGIGQVFGGGGRTHGYRFTICD